MSGRDTAFTAELIAAFGYAAIDPNIQAPYLPLSGGDGGIIATVHRPAERAAAIVDFIATAAPTTDDGPNNAELFIQALDTAASARKGNAP